MPRKKELFRIRIYSSSGLDREFIITWRGFSLISMLILLMVGGFFLSSSGLIRWSHLKIENARLKSENRSLRQKIEYLGREISFLRTRMDSIFEMNNQLRLAMGLPEVPEDIKYMGMGGYIDRDTVRNEIDAIRNLVNMEYRDLQNLKKMVQEKQEELKYTPSILPSYGYMTSGFGYRRDPFTGRVKFHEGLDISAPTGTPVYAPADGIVTFVGIRNGYGLTVEIKHGDRYITRYAHLSESLVRVGQKVQRGDMIARVGNSGRSTGPHLHYEVLKDGVPVNPRKFIILGEVVYD